VPSSSHSGIEKLSNGNYHTAIIDGVFFLLNAYAAMTQRYNRARIYHTIERIHQRR